MLECHEFLSWLVEVMEKIKAHDDHTLRFVLPLVTQVRKVTDITQGQNF